MAMASSLSPQCEMHFLSGPYGPALRPHRRAARRTVGVPAGMPPCPQSYWEFCNARALPRHPSELPPCPDTPRLPCFEGRIPLSGHRGDRSSCPPNRPTTTGEDSYEFRNIVRASSGLWPTENSTLWSMAQREREAARAAASFWALQQQI